MNSVMQVSKSVAKKQCTGSFAAKRCLITFTAPQRHISSDYKVKDTKITTLFQRRQFSDSPSPSEPSSNERDSLINGTPSPEIKQLADDILNLNTIDMTILIEIVQVGAAKLTQKVRSTSK